MRLQQCFRRRQKNSNRSSNTHGSDFRVGQICGNWYIIHLGRWSRAWKSYQGGWGGGLHLHLPCPMAPSAVAAGPVKKNGSDSDFWPFSGRPPPIGALDRASADGAVLIAQPPRSPFQAPDRPCKCTTWRVGRIGASRTPLLLCTQRALCTCF